MAALKSNSSKAAREIACDIGHRFEEPKRLFKAMELSPIGADVALKAAVANRDWELVALIGLAQAHNSQIACNRGRA